MVGSNDFLKNKSKIVEITTYMAATKAMASIEKPLSIKKPNIAVPNAVEKTIKAVVIAFMLPMFFTPYISAQVEEPRTLAKPFEAPIRPKNTKEEKG